MSRTGETMNKRARSRHGFSVPARGLVLATASLAGLTTLAVVPVQPAVAVGAVARTAVKAAPLALRVYFMKGDKLAVAGRTVPPTKAVARAALLQLLAGPIRADAARGLTSCIPTGTRLLGVSVTHGTATVGLSGTFAKGGGSLSMTARLAEVAYTVTQFPTVTGVVFAMDGKVVKVFGGEGIILDHPATRSSFESLTPAILVESPTAGQRVSTPVRLSGSANVFEAVFEAELTDSSGHVIAHRVVQATSGTGTRGTFSAEMSYSSAEARSGFLVVYDVSAKNGARLNTTRVPIVLNRT